MVQREVAEDMDRRNYSTNTGQISPSPNEIKMQKEQSEKVEFLTLLHTLELLTGAVTIKKKNNHSWQHCGMHHYGSFLHFKPFSQNNSSISAKW